MISRLLRKNAVQNRAMQSLRHGKYYYGTDDYRRYMPVKEPQELKEYYK